MKVSITVEVLLEGGYASLWVGSGEAKEEGTVKDGGGCTRMYYIIVLPSSI